VPHPLVPITIVLRTLNTIEKIEVAKALEELGVDVIEAGFPVSSPGDFNSIVEVSKAVTSVVSIRESELLLFTSNTS